MAGDIDNDGLAADGDSKMSIGQLTSYLYMQNLGLDSFITSKSYMGKGKNQTTRSLGRNA